MLFYILNIHSPSLVRMFPNTIWSGLLMRYVEKDHLSLLCIQLLLLSSDYTISDSPGTAEDPRSSDINYSRIKIPGLSSFYCWHKNSTNLIIKMYYIMEDTRNGLLGLGQAENVLVGIVT